LFKDKEVWSFISGEWRQDSDNWSILKLVSRGVHTVANWVPASYNWCLVTWR